MNSISNKDKGIYFKFLNSLPRKINKLYFSKLKGKFKIKNKSKNKKNFDPVTNVDKSLEMFLRSKISQKFPDHEIVGEEFKAKKTKSPFSWSIDPIDGTRSFVIGHPIWSNLISLSYKNRPILGLVNFPELNKYYITGPNNTAYRVEKNKRLKLQVSKKQSFKNPKISGDFFGYLSLKQQQKILKLIKLFRFPCPDALSFCLLSEGKIDVVVQATLKSWDILPLIPLVKQSGGHVTTWDNQDPKIGGKIVASSNIRIHKQVLKMLKPVSKY